MARPHSRATITLALKPADLRLFDFTDDSGDDKVSLQPHAGPLNRRHRLDVTRKSGFHIDQTAPVNAILLDYRFLRIVEVIHVRIEHQGRAAAGPFQSADHVGPALFDFLILNLHAQLLKFAAEVLGNTLLFAGNADDISQVASQFDNSVAIHLLQDFFLHHVLLISHSCVQFKNFL